MRQCRNNPRGAIISASRSKERYDMGRNRIISLDNFQTFQAINILSDPGAIPGPVVVPQCATITLQWNTETGRPAHNVLFGRYSGTFAGTQAQANSILTALTTGAAWTALAAFLTTGVNLAVVNIRDVNTRDQPIISSNATGGVGTSTGTSLPLETALVGTLRTANVGRANRGRIYLPGWATTALGASNLVAAGAVTAYGNWLGTISGILAAQGYTWVIGQRARQAYQGSTGTQHPARNATSVPVTSVVVRDNHWDSQRRRGNK